MALPWYFAPAKLMYAECVRSSSSAPAASTIPSSVYSASNPSRHVPTSVLGSPVMSGRTSSRPVSRRIMNVAAEWSPSSRSESNASPSPITPSNDCCRTLEVATDEPRARNRHTRAGTIERLPRPTQRGEQVVVALSHFSGRPSVVGGRPPSERHLRQQAVVVELLGDTNRLVKCAPCASGRTSGT